LDAPQVTVFFSLKKRRDLRPHKHLAAAEDKFSNKFSTGDQVWKRDIVQSPGKVGQECPELVFHMKCNRKMCPINCQLASWSGWSKCTADCGGGLKSRYR
jgi:hypothetical protein